MEETHRSSHIMLVSEVRQFFADRKIKVTHHAQKRSRHYVNNVIMSAQEASKTVEVNWLTAGRRYVCTDPRSFPTDFSVYLCLRTTIDLFDFWYALTMQYYKVKYYGWIKLALSCMRASFPAARITP